MNLSCLVFEIWPWDGRPIDQRRQSTHIWPFSWAIAVSFVCHTLHDVRRNIYIHEIFVKNKYNLFYPSTVMRNTNQPNRVSLSFALYTSCHVSFVAGPLYWPDMHSLPTSVRRPLSVVDFSPRVISRKLSKLDP